MSGSGGSDDWKFRGISPAAGGASGSVGEEKCRFVHTTLLNSPNASVLQTLSIGDQLDITNNGISIVAITRTGQTAGSITYKHLVDLVECIGDGWKYVAIVLEINGGSCKIQIKVKE